MLGLGSNLTKGGAGAKTIVTDGLVLKHNYAVGAVQPLSDGAAYFDASGNDAISMGDQDDLSFGTGSFSMSCWVYSTQTGASNFVVSKKAGATIANVGYALYLGNSGTDWVFSASDGTDYAAPATTVNQNANQWYHLCGTFDGVAKTAKLYVDGVLVATVTDTDIGDIDTTQPFQIGKTGTSTSTDWDGYICNVGTWDAVLSQAQIKSIMNKNYAGLSDSEKTSLVSWWNLDSVIPDTTTLVYDNHHGGGEVLGSEEVTNGDFATDLSGWDNKSATSTWVSGSARIDNSTGNARAGLYQDIGLVLGNSYILTATMKLISGDANGNFKVITSAFNGSGQTDIYTGESLIIGGSSVTETIKFTHSNSDVSIQFACNTTNAVFEIDNVSVKLINGNTGTLS